MRLMMIVWVAVFLSVTFTCQAWTHQLPSVVDPSLCRSRRSLLSLPGFLAIATPSVPAGATPDTMTVASAATSVPTQSSLTLSTTTLGQSSPTAGYTPREAETQYDDYASSYDRLDGGSLVTSILGPARQQLVSHAQGKVLELGVGTGLNLDYYLPTIQQVSSLTLVDVSSEMLQQAQQRWDYLTSLSSTMTSASTVPVSWQQADATSQLTGLISPDDPGALFDTVVETFSLCVMQNPGACLDQINRVVRPGTGKILLLENARASNPVVGWYQDRTADAAARLGGKGCVSNQNVLALVQQSVGDTWRLDSEELYAGGLFRAYEFTKRA